MFGAKVGKMERGKKAKASEGWKRGVEIGGVFELVDSVNEYARRRSSLLPGISD